ncbi:MAG: hypothetical protein KGI06_03855 [Candidatus Micrarchaeota archaeon]|nr:hypothetical protein [Candidatus Micrarchaeota archaeon]
MKVKHIEKTAHNTYNRIRVGYYNYLSVPVSIATFLVIFEGFLLLIFPQLRTLSSGAIGLISFMVMIALAYYFGYRYEKMYG